MEMSAGVAPLARLERTTFRLGGGPSIPVRYRGVWWTLHGIFCILSHCQEVVNGECKTIYPGKTTTCPKSLDLRGQNGYTGDVSAQTENQIYAVHLRLYELEERLDTTRFVRISNSEIINLDRVTAIDLSLAGTIRMTLEGAVHAYVSRRYVKKIKDTLNLRGGDKT